MKRSLAALVVAACGMVHGEDFSVVEPADQEIVDVSIIDKRPSIEGIVKQVFSKKPWQAVNPAAPAKYGSGQKNVSKDSGPGTVFHSTGLVVLGVEW